MKILLIIIGIIIGAIILAIGLFIWLTWEIQKVDWWKGKKRE